MHYVAMSKERSIGTLTLNRGKVNALNDEVVQELHAALQDVAYDEGIRAVVLTGAGKFFSFGFDIPQFLSYSKEQFTAFLKAFTDLYAHVFLFPKPVIAALNGHTIAGGCMLATACDYRIMVAGKARISLNEVTFGSSVLAGSVEMLKACVGHANAEKILLTGGMYSAEDALAMGLIHQVAAEDNLLREANQVAENFAATDPMAFRSVKNLLRKPVAEHMRAGEQASIREFVDIWYAENTREQLKKITIRS
jgi:enoyl-CoA hydratase/carnithine racemase